MQQQIIRLIIQRLDLQDKEIKTLKTILFVLRACHNWDSCDNISIKIANSFVAHLQFFQKHRAKQK
ncbi:MAG: hypothetical protein IPF63_04865 [Bacteroidetes bacterium]|nr:hypothetical protein [Bacteroidota bacterium]